jgi:hypothetical protein
MHEYAYKSFLEEERGFKYIIKREEEYDTTTDNNI